MTNADTLTNCYKDAALQRYLMQSRDGDRKLIEAGWRLFYAVDSNVVGFFLEPHRHAVRSVDRRIGLGDIFQLDSLRNQHDISVLVADYPILSLDMGCPLIAIEPINEEIRAIYERHSTAFFAAQEGHLNGQQLADRLNALDIDKLSPKDRVLLTHAVTLDHPVVAAADRIYSLTRAGRILSSERVSGRTHSPELARALRMSATASDTIAFALGRAKWLGVFAHVGRQKDGRAQRDAAALARLELCNTRLRNAGVRQRLHYITGDSFLLEAAEGVPWEEVGGIDTFAAAFLRHPRAFLDEPEVLQPTEEDRSEEGTTLANWLKVLLGRIDQSTPNLRPVDGHISFSDEVIGMMNQVVAEDDGAAERILNRWREFTRRVADTGVAPKANVERLTALLHNQAAIDEVERLRNQLEAEVEEAWTKVFYVSAAARLALEVAAHDGGYDVPDREVPRLVFQARPALAHFLREAGRWFIPGGEFDHATYEAMRQAVRREDETQYGDYVGHAFVLAQQGQWKSASILAGLATSRVHGRNDFAPQKSNGRESAYLQAYCTRLTSRSPDDLAKAFQFIDRALEIAGVEQEHTVALGLVHEAVSERFEMERFVLRATMALYQWQAGNADYLRLTFEELLPEIQDLADRIRVKLSNLHEHPLNADYDPKMIEIALVSVLGRCLRTSLGMRFHLGDFGEVSRQIWTELDTYCDHNKAPSQFSEFLCRVGRATFDEQISWRHRRKNLDALAFRLPARILPYDRNRYDTILNRARDALSAQRR
ncbi:hypothetical protein NDN01_06570 [Sphingomonas sp. QA11]|uniref:hypothetical protein n=1 Tax=Sphingomonas sp. QA11 TaxID=2950605 RepID=UPI0023495F43|nr:hypothetical protein [Sphingomonas sp. QA11]WCM28581.1 hypothetical protein NDN01_06570 [Sphingomonas sp. QA11]